MKIKVSKQMIVAGVIGDPCNCPLGLAFAGEGFNVSVAPDHVDFYDGHSGVICGTLPLPAVAQRFQNDFDSRHTVQPFEFDMPGLERGITPRTDFQSVEVTS